MKTNTKRIAVETQNGVRYYSVPEEALRDASRTPACERGTGFYVTDTYYSPRGLVIERCWDDQELSAEVESLIRAELQKGTSI